MTCKRPSATSETVRDISEILPELSDLRLKLLLLRLVDAHCSGRPSRSPLIHSQLLLIALQLTRQTLDLLLKMRLAGLSADKSFSGLSVLLGLIVMTSVCHTSVILHQIVTYSFLNADTQILEFEVFLKSEVSDGITFLRELRSQVLAAIIRQS